MLAHRAFTYKKRPARRKPTLAEILNGASFAVTLLSLVVALQQPTAYGPQPLRLDTGTPLRGAGR